MLRKLTQLSSKCMKSMINQNKVLTGYKFSEIKKK